MSDPLKMRYIMCSNLAFLVSIFLNSIFFSLDLISNKVLCFDFKVSVLLFFIIIGEKNKKFDFLVLSFIATFFFFNNQKKKSSNITKTGFNKKKRKE